MKIDWSQRAISDLAALHDFIARDSRLYAERFVAKLIRADHLAGQTPWNPDQQPSTEAES